MTPDFEAKHFVDAAQTRGFARFPDAVAAFPELGISLDFDMVRDYACPACGSVYVKSTATEPRTQSGSSLRLRGSSALLEADIPDNKTRGMLFSLVCEAGGSCDYAMTTGAFFRKALEEVGAVEFIRRVRPLALGDYFPKVESYFAAYLQHARKKGVFIAPRSATAAVGKLEAGAGVCVLLQEVQAISISDAGSKLDPKAWEDCETDASGALLRAADLERLRAEAKAKAGAEAREADIAAKLAEHEAKLRATTKGNN